MLASLDFEGTATDPPSLLGVYWEVSGEEHFRQFILEKDLAPMAEHCSASTPWEVTVATPDDAVGFALGLIGEGDKIFAWSSRETAVIDELCDPKVSRTATGAVQNAIPLAKRWKRRHHPDVRFVVDHRRRKNALTNYMDLIGYPVPRALGPGNTASRIRAVRAGLQARDHDPSRLTATQKGKWTKLLGHNYHDCRGTVEVVKRVLEDRP